MSVSAFFKDRCDRLLPGGYGAFFPADAPLYRGVTVNGLRCTPEQFQKIAPFGAEPSGFDPANFRLADNSVKVGLHPYHHAGVYYGQEPSASAPASLLGVQPGDRVLDLCAAPGGKTAQLAARLAGKGVLYSNEIMPDRARILLSNVERMGVSNSVVLNDRAEDIAAAFPEYFDRILVDAPCSGEGMFRKEPQAVTQHSQRLVESCAETGRHILDVIAEALRPGGELVYSTCTFAPEEDEGAIGWFLARHPEFELVDTGAEFGCGGHESCCTEGPIDVSRVRRIYPIHGGEGHFMAKLRKAGQSGCRLPAPKSRIAPKPLPAEAQDFLKKTFPRLADRQFYNIKDSWFLLPETDIYLPRGLHPLRAGVPVGEVIKKRFEPHHGLFTAFGAECANTERLAAGEARTAAYLRGEEIDAATGENGFAAVLCDGFCLGFGKISQGKLKNRYPKGLRNLK